LNPQQSFQKSLQGKPLYFHWVLFVPFQMSHYYEERAHSRPIARGNLTDKCFNISFYRKKPTKKRFYRELIIQRARARYTLESISWGEKELT
jgi:hypothetical protein